MWLLAEGYVLPNEHAYAFRRMSLFYGKQHILDFDDREALIGAADSKDEEIALYIWKSLTEK
jgi:hypothetical protein